MLLRHRITGFFRKHVSPFVCPFIPFVCHKPTIIIPLICREQPIVRNSGFTLIELIITLTVASILMALAVPGFQSFISSNRLTAQINDVIADISLSRNEAIKRNTTTGVCVSTSGTTCATGGNWANGWLVYYVCPSTDTTCTANANVVIRAHETLVGNNTLVLSPAIDAVVYGKTGLISSGTVTITLCDSNAHKSRVIAISPAGRPSLSENTC